LLGLFLPCLNAQNAETATGRPGSYGKAEIPSSPVKILAPRIKAESLNSEGSVLPGLLNVNSQLEIEAGGTPRNVVPVPDSVAKNQGEPLPPWNRETSWLAQRDNRVHAQWDGIAPQRPFSRMGIGAGVSSLGFGISSAIVMTQCFDARLMVNSLSFRSGNMEVFNHKLDANLRLASVGTSLDWYPFGSIWRLSAGMLVYNGNYISATPLIRPGQSFTVHGDNFYSATKSPATGTSPLAASGVLGLHTKQPSFVLSGGYGKFIPRSNRHWSFPFEVGAAFIGPPTLSEKTAGWVCKDAKQTRCGNLADPTNRVTIEFDDVYQAALTNRRRELRWIGAYPLLSYGVVYSFKIR
jgi:hypothetical protein